MRNPPRILVVDDNPTNLEVLRVRLNSQGYEVVTAVDGEDALIRARELDPDLVLLDVMMPKLDGISVLKELKASNVHGGILGDFSFDANGDITSPRIPIIRITGTTRPGTGLPGSYAGSVLDRMIHAPASLGQ